MENALDLVGVSEIAELTQFSRQAVVNWRNRDPEFPPPACELKSGPIWRREDVLKWAEQRGLGLRTDAESKQSRTQSRGGSMAKSVAVVNMKGGVGKSTLTANLGWYCAYKKHKRVLLVDLDPQFNLSQYLLGSERYEELFLNSAKLTVLDIFEEHTPFAVSGGPRPRLTPEDVICPVRRWKGGSGLELIGSRLELAWTLKNPHQKEHLLAAFLRKVSDQYDLVLVDCPPTESMLTDAAYLASEYILVPVKPEFLSTIGLPLLARSIDEFAARHEHQSLQIAGILFNSSSEYKAEHARSKEYVSKLAADNGWYVFSKEVSYSDSYPAGARLGKPIFLTEYARWWKVAEFEDVAEEFIRRIDL